MKQTTWCQSIKEGVGTDLGYKNIQIESMAIYDENIICSILYRTLSTSWWSTWMFKCDRKEDECVGLKLSQNKNETMTLKREQNTDDLSWSKIEYCYSKQWEESECWTSHGPSKVGGQQGVFLTHQSGRLPNHQMRRKPSNFRSRCFLPADG